MRRIERGDQARGISLKLQEEERERRMDFVPEVSAVDTERIVVDADAMAMLTDLGLTFDVTVAKPRTEFGDRPRGPRRKKA